MFKNKYSNFLTITLIITIILIIAIIAVFVVKVYKDNQKEKDALNAVVEFENEVNTNNNEDKTNNGQNLVIQDIEQNSGETQEGALSTGTREPKYYKNFVMLGYIEIPSINIKYPILEKETVESLEQSVAVRYPVDNAKLNEKGNIVIAGHNYRNGKFFSNLKKVSTGDTVKITDINGQTLTYTIYEKYETTPEDTSYITRDIGDNTQITLVTCTDNSKARIVVKAKV